MNDSYIVTPYGMIDEVLKGWEFEDDRIFPGVWAMQDGIDRETVSKLHHKCVESHAAYTALLNDPQHLREIDLSLPQQKDGLATAFTDVKTALTQSVELQKALAIAVA